MTFDPIRLLGKRTVLRDWRLTDLPDWAEWMKPGHAWQDLDGPYYPKPSPQQLDKQLERYEFNVAKASWPTPRKQLVIAQRDSDKLIGVVSWSWESKETFWPLVGIVIFDEARWGKGHGYEALGLWSAYLFGELPEIVRLDLRTWSGNTGMMRLAEKLGYSLEASFRKARIVKGAYYDGLGYGVLRDEWEARYPGGFWTTL